MRWKPSLRSQGLPFPINPTFLFLFSLSIPIKFSLCNSWVTWWWWRWWWYEVLLVQSSVVELRAFLVDLSSSLLSEISDWFCIFWIVRHCCIMRAWFFHGEYSNLFFADFLCFLWKLAEKSISYRICYMLLSINGGKVVIEQAFYLISATCSYTFHFIVHFGRDFEEGLTLWLPEAIDNFSYFLFFSFFCRELGVVVYPPPPGVIFLLLV